MNKSIWVTTVIAFTILSTSMSIDVFAQNMSQGANETAEKTGAAMNETGEAAGNATQGIGGAMNETGDVLSNITGNIVEGAKNLFNGSSN